MSDYYNNTHRDLHDAFDSRRLADTIEEKMISSELGEREMRFITTADMFFLSTMDKRGFPTVSYKGGEPGFVKVLDPSTIAFPIYDGNGMFYSAGNIGSRAQVGLLFIDFVTPRRMRLHGTAQISSGDPLINECKEAQLIVRVEIEDAFLNCARYIHKFSREDLSDYAPREGHDTAIPLWKHMDFAEPLLSTKDQLRPASDDKKVTMQEYRDDFWRDLG